MKKTTRKFIQQLVILLIFFVGALVMLYPFYSDALSNTLDQIRITQFQKQFAAEETAQRLARLKEAAKTNQEAQDPFSTKNGQQEELRFKEHLLGTLNIPKLSLELPIFDQTNERLLEVGAGLVAGTSLPFGGMGTHSVLAAHRGLPQKKLFTDLPDLEEGDLFVIDLFDEKLAYQVDQISVVLPEQIEVLAIHPDEDIVTLLTCTPYMINSQRLLVRGHRVPYTEAVAATVKSGNRDRTILQTLIIISFVLLFRLIQAWRYRKEKVTISFSLKNRMGQPIENFKFSIWDKKGRKPLKRQGQPLCCKTNQKGEVFFIGLPKDFYQIKANESAGVTLLIGRRKKSKNGYFVKLRKNSQGQLYSRENGELTLVL